PACTASRTGGSSARGNSRCTRSATRWPLVPDGSTCASVVVKRIPRKGIPSATSNAAVAVAIGRGRRITSRARRYQKPRSDGRERPPQRVAAACELLAVARDDEEAVVDRQPEPHPCDEVQGVLGDRHRLGREAEPEERARDRDHADERRQQRRDETAEDEQREQ